MTVRILGIGGSTRPESSSENALRVAMSGAAAEGADVELITGRDLMLPIYDTEVSERTPEALRFLEALSRADGLVIASPGYHGTMSGLMKNVLDYVEDLRGTERIYLDGMAVGCVAVAYGWQATVTTLGMLRTTVHALRGWPTPLGAAVNATVTKIQPDGSCDDEATLATLRTVGAQVAQFAMRGGAGPAEQQLRPTPAQV